MKDRPWSISARSRTALDSAAPRKDRFIRYWPWPYGRMQNVQGAARAGGLVVLPGRLVRVCHPELDVSESGLVLIGRQDRRPANPLQGQGGGSLRPTAVYMSSFIAKKLDVVPCYPRYSLATQDTQGMKTRTPPASGTRRTARLIRERIERGGERLWRFEDFRDQPSAAVAQALSRLVKAGVIERLSKGTYYRTKQTVFGKSRPNPAAIQKLASRNKSLFPSGTAAANRLGFTTQTARRGELATSAMSLPRKLVGQDTVIHTRRPEAWSSLSETDAAMLDFLRRGGKTSELSPRETVRRTLELLSERGRYKRLIQVVGTEPPRVRAMLGALGEQLGEDPQVLRRLRASLNQLSRFDFGMFTDLPTASSWQTRKRSPRETV